MPFYEYECCACSHQLEVLQKISDAHLRKCPDCGKSTLKRLISAPVFRLKGAGWYETDFKSENEQKRNIAERDETEVKAEAKADDKADSKDAKEAKDTKDAPEGKSESKPEAAKSEPKESETTQRKSVAKPVKAPVPTSKGKPEPKAKAAPNAKLKAKAKAKPAKKKAARR